MNNAAHCKDVLATCAVQLIVIQKCHVCQMAGTFYFFYHTSSEIHSVDNTAAIPFDLHQLRPYLLPKEVFQQFLSFLSILQVNFTI